MSRFLHSNIDKHLSYALKRTEDLEWWLVTPVGDRSRRPQTPLNGLFLIYSALLGRSEQFYQISQYSSSEPAAFLYHSKIPTFSSRRNAIINDLIVEQLGDHRW